MQTTDTLLETWKSGIAAGEIVPILGPDKKEGSKDDIVVPEKGGES